jgi:hypothetical protein
MIIATKSLLADNAVPASLIHHDPLPPGHAVPPTDQAKETGMKDIMREVL